MTFISPPVLAFLLLNATIAALLLVSPNLRNIISIQLTTDNTTDSTIHGRRINRNRRVGRRRGHGTPRLQAPQPPPSLPAIQIQEDAKEGSYFKKSPNNVTLTNVSTNGDHDDHHHHHHHLVQSTSLRAPSLITTPLSLSTTIDAAPYEKFGNECYDDDNTKFTEYIKRFYSRCDKEM